MTNGGRKVPLTPWLFDVSILGTIYQNSVIQLKLEGATQNSGRVSKLYRIRSGIIFLKVGRVNN